ncbi:MAG: V-type ATP synthase subunit D [Desulfurococcales archaeon]|nr:V-type ATP synthase subunit D [Desulfurococcales archaeon]
MAIDPRKVLPTKLNLIRLRREYTMMTRIRRVIEEKREVILHYLTSIASEYARYREEVLEELERIYSSYYVGAASEGFERVKVYAESVPETLRINVGMRVLFAVRIPTFNVAEETIPPITLPPGVDPKLYESFEGIRRLLPKLLKLAEYEETINRLLEELRETQRLINALDYVILPSYRDAIKYIKLVLEDRQREEFIRLKLIKRKLEKKAGG